MPALVVVVVVVVALPVGAGNSNRVVTVQTAQSGPFLTAQIMEQTTLRHENEADYFVISLIDNRPIMTPATCRGQQGPVTRMPSTLAVVAGYMFVHPCCVVHK